MYSSLLADETPEFDIEGCCIPIVPTSPSTTDLRAYMQRLIIVGVHGQVQLPLVSGLRTAESGLVDSKRQIKQSYINQIFLCPIVSRNWASWAVGRDPSSGHRLHLQMHCAMTCCPEQRAVGEIIQHVFLEKKLPD
jgi:hypothetical protein